MAARARGLPPALALGAALVSAAAAPEVAFLDPPGAPAGATLALRVAGRFSAWPTAVWCAEPGLSFLAGPAPGHFEVRVAADATPGPHWVRFWDASGASAPSLFVVGEGAEHTWPETGPVPDPPPQPPVTLQGRLELATPIHAWPLNLPGPATARFEAAAMRLDSPGTVQLTLSDATGAVLGRSTNTPPADPVLECLVPRSGSCTLSVAVAGSGEAAGAADAVGPAGPVFYRVAITTRSVEQAAALVPPGIWLEGAPLPGATSRVVLREMPAPAEPVLHPETLSPTAELSGTFGGFLNPAGDQDRFSFSARRQELRRFRGRVINEASGLWLVLRVLAPDGTVLAVSNPGLETALEWEAPAEGVFVLAVADAADSGGPDFAYELEATPPQPHLTARTPDHTLHLGPGERRVLAVQVQRPESFRRVLTLTVAGLPPAVQAHQVILAPDADSARFELLAAPDAPAFSGPLRLTVLDPAAAPPVTFPVLAPVVGRHAPPGGLWLNETDVLWLTVEGR